MNLRSWLNASPSIRLVRRRSTAGLATIEALEQRTLLTAYVVDTLNDVVAADGKVSLREAIQAANGNVPVNEAAAGQGGAVTDTITFHPSLAGQVITLSGTELLVTSNLSITGLGSSQLSISGNDASRIFRVTDTANLVVSSVSLVNGLGAATLEMRDGGAIYNAGTLTLNSVVLSDNTAKFRGMTIFNEGTLTMVGGALLNSTGGPAIDSRGTFTTTGTRFADNDGGSVIANWGALTVHSALFENNEAAAATGIHNFGGSADALVTNSTFVNNLATTGSGAALHNQGNTFQVINSTFRGNIASNGGAIENFSGTMEVSGSTFTENQATFHGGAIRSSGTLHMWNSTVSGNAAAWNGGGIDIWAGDTTLRNVTIAFNKANSDQAGFGDGGGIHVSGAPTVTLYNSLVIGNTRDDAITATAEDIFGTVSESSGSNLIGTIGASGGLVGGTNGNIIGASASNVINTTLGNNGGPTLTHSLTSGSAAINAGNNLQAINADGVTLATDQRGTSFARISQGIVDIGAVEFGATVNSPAVARSDMFSVGEDAVLTGNVFADNGAGADFDPDGDPLSVLAVNGNTLWVGTTISLMSGARLRLNATGDFEYDPNGAFDDLDTGVMFDDVFSYTLVGGSTVTVIVRVVGADEDSSNGPAEDLIAFHRGLWRVAVSNGTSFTSTYWAGWSDAAWSALKQGDFNGDGRTDVLGLISGYWYIGISNGSGFSTSLWTRWANVPWQDVSIADLDGDGKDDILARVGGNWWGALSSGSAFAAPTLWATWSNAPWQHVSLVDLNNDGQADLLGYLFGEWWAALSDGSRFGTATAWERWSNVPWEQVGTFDADDDGRIDVFAMLAGEWYVARSNGSAFTTSLRMRWSTVAWKDAIAGDFDGDGRDDLAARYGGSWWVSLSNPTGGNQATGRWAGWSDIGWTVRVGDFDGDGNDDLAGYYAGEWWVGRSTGTAFTTSKWDTWANVAWQSIAASDTNTSPATAASAPLAARVELNIALSDEEESLARFWSAAKDDEELAAGLLAV